MRRTTFLALALCATLAFAGCGDDNGDNDIVSAGMVRVV